MNDWAIRGGERLAFVYDVEVEQAMNRDGVPWPVPTSEYDLRTDNL